MCCNSNRARGSVVVISFYSVNNIRLVLFRGVAGFVYCLFSKVALMKPSIAFNLPFDFYVIDALNVEYNPHTKQQTANSKKTNRTLNYMPSHDVTFWPAFRSRYIQIDFGGVMGLGKYAWYIWLFAREPQLMHTHTHTHCFIFTLAMELNALNGMALISTQVSKNRRNTL